jgi:hypothetical protein
MKRQLLVHSSRTAQEARRKKMRLLSLFSLFGCIAALPTAANDPFPIPAISIDAYSGTACPQGTVEAFISSTGSPGSYRLVTVFKSATVWPPAAGIIASQVSKNCALQLDVQLPKGWMYSVNSAGTDVQGYLWLPDEQRTGRAYLTYYFPLTDALVSSSCPTYGRD